MNTDAVWLIDACARLKTRVIGDAILDEYVEGDTGRLCREAPVPIVTVARRHYAPGRRGECGGECGHPWESSEPAHRHRE